MTQRRNYGRTSHHRPGIPQQHEMSIPPVEYQVGHNGTHILMMFTKPIRAMALDDKGFDTLIANLQTIKAELEKARAAKPNG